jgi:hypothetical protein
MDFKVETRDGINKLWLKPNEYENGVKYALEHDIKSLFFIHDETEKQYTIDFSWLKELPEIDTLEFMIPLSKQSNIDGIYELKKLKMLSYHYNNYDRLPLNHTKLKSLEYLYTKYSKNHKNRESGFEALENLKTIKLWHIKNEENCMFLGNLNTVNRLELTWSRSLKTLDGIENIDLLDGLSLINISQLEDISALLKLNPLKSLWVENCKKINEDGIRMLKENYMQFRPNIFCSKN